jgi:HAD superfamily hydrolase (TIGR01509 family)
MTAARFDLIVFDCDGVLVDSEVLAVRAMCDTLVAAGVPATETMVLGSFGMKQADTLRRIADETGHDIPTEVPGQLWPATRRAFENGLRPMPGVEAVVRGVPEHRRCVASSSHPERIRTSLAITGLEGLFGDRLFSSHEVARGKPAPDLFLHAAARLGVRPERCAVIEDSVYGIEGARAAGMTAFGFTGGSHVGAGHGEVLRQAGAVTVADSWHGLGPYLLG